MALAKCEEKAGRVVEFGVMSIATLTFLLYRLQINNHNWDSVVY